MNGGIMQTKDVEFVRSRRPLVCVLGGTGFVGHHLVNHLTEHGYRVRVPSRRPQRHRELGVLPHVELLEANVHDPQTLAGLVDGCEAVVNLVAILNEERAGDFQRVHVELPRKLIQACQERGVTRLLHMSALNADPRGGLSRYLTSKGEGEALVHNVPDLRVTSFRPAIIFGLGDHFFNRFATLLRISPGVFPLACPRSRFAPVFVDDLVGAMIHCLEDRATIGQRYDLCGPHAYTLEELVTFTARTIGVRRLILPLGEGLSKLQARIMQYLPGKPFTYDNYLSLQVDCVCRGAFPPVFGIDPQPIESIVPEYLANRTLRGRFDQFRALARHEY